MPRREKDSEQRGPVDHAPGQHGKKTYSRVAEISQTGNPAEDRAGPGHDAAKVRNHDHHEGKVRLFENREQHDEADRNSEKTRLARDMDRHEHGSPEDERHHLNVQSSAKRKS